MNKEQLLEITGSLLPCYNDCKIGHCCFGGWSNEEDECDKGINQVKQSLDNIPNVKTLTLIMARADGFFAIRVLDRSSNVRPLPEVGTLMIKNGKLS